VYWFVYPKKSFQSRKHTEDTETQYIPGATIHHLAGDDGAGVKLMIISVFVRVIPWQMRFIGLFKRRTVQQVDAIENKRARSGPLSKQVSAA